MKNTVGPLTLFFLVSFPGAVKASCPPPDHFGMELNRDWLFVEFRWNGAGAVDGCESNEAFEFEVKIEGAPAKCFAQPIGGQDDDDESEHVIMQMPEGSEPYVDVWNYYFDYTVQETTDIFEQNCPGAPSVLASLGTWWLELRGNEFEDEHINLAVGVRDSGEFQRGEMYGFFYDLEIPNREECAGFDSASWGDVTVSYSTFPNTCTISEFAGLEIGPYIMECPYFIGALACDEADPQHPILAERICAPTDFYTFPLTAPQGLQDVSKPGEEWVVENTGACVDNDGDGVFAVWGNSHGGNPTNYFGTNVGDCDDDDPSITRQGYEYHTVAGHCGICTYEVTEHECDNWTEADGLGAGGGKMFAICGVTNEHTGAVSIAARKYDATSFGEREYRVRVSGYDDDSCGPAFNYKPSDGDPIGIGSDQLIFNFDSIWTEGQTQKGYCVTASTQPGDPGYDEYDPGQVSWWWSDRIELTRTCQ